MAPWKIRAAPGGDGVWLLRATADAVVGLCPPNTRLLPRDRRRRDEGALLRWRKARWSRPGPGQSLTIERQRPQEVTELDTVAVLALLPRTLHAEVWTLMTRQLRLALLSDRSVPGHGVPDEPARVGAMAVRWLREQLLAAFPERADEIPRSPVPPLGELAADSRAFDDERERLRAVLDGGALRPGMSLSIDGVVVLGKEPIAPVEPDWSDRSERAVGRFR